MCVLNPFGNHKMKIIFSTSSSSCSSDIPNYQVEHWKNSEVLSTMKFERQKAPSANSNGFVGPWWL